MSYSKEGALTLTCSSETEVAFALGFDNMMELLDADTRRRVALCVENAEGTIFEKVLKGMDFNLVEQVISRKSELYQTKVALVWNDSKSLEPFIAYLVSLGFGVRGTLKTRVEGKTWRYTTRLGSKQLKCKVKEPKPKVQAQQSSTYVEMKVDKCVYCYQNGLGPQEYLDDDTVSIE